ncbi:hypothetical protein V8G54_034502 [Vigna mungo]|uniref:Uncharacterized protein n=1 Tax=Vigna mungo TaxID=3915 RepID=A0AAQ3MRR2_VIGMU
MIIKNWDEPILLELVRELWKNASVKPDCITLAVVVSIDTIAEAINSSRGLGRNLRIRWIVERVLYGENIERKFIRNDIIVEKLSEPTKALLHICTRTFLHSNGGANKEGCHYSSLIFKIFVKQGVINHISIPTFPTPILDDIHSDGATRGKRLCLKELGNLSVCQGLRVVIVLSCCKRLRLFISWVAILILSSERSALRRMKGEAYGEKKKLKGDKDTNPVLGSSG